MMKISNPYCMIVYRPENKMIPYLHTRPKKFESFPVSDTKFFFSWAPQSLKNVCFPSQFRSLNIFRLSLSPKNKPLLRALPCVLSPVATELFCSERKKESIGIILTQRLLWSSFPNIVSSLQSMFWLIYRNKQ